MTREQLEALLIVGDGVPYANAHRLVRLHDAEQRQEIARLREALKTLHSLQNGCPLPKYETDYLHCMVQVERLLGLDKEEHP